MKIENDSLRASNSQLSEQLKTIQAQYGIMDKKITTLQYGQSDIFARLKELEAATLALNQE